MANVDRDYPLLLCIPDTDHYSGDKEVLRVEVAYMSSHDPTGYGDVKESRKKVGPVVN